MHAPSDLDIAGTLKRARALAAAAVDEAAKLAYLDILRQDPTHFSALNELGTLAFSGGFRSAARTAYQASLDIAARLTAADPANTEWQRDLQNIRVKIEELPGSP